MEKSDVTVLEISSHFLHPKYFERICWLPSKAIALPSLPSKVSKLPISHENRNFLP
jgi:hypothetical protein